MTKEHERRSGRSRYTEQQRAQRAAADQKLFEQSTADMADPDLVADRMRTALAGMSPRILGYSLRNQMLLIRQADQRGIKITDVDTYRGWKRRCRHVRQGEQGLRIVRPVGTDDDDQPDPAEGGDHDRDDSNGDGDVAPRPRFRFTPRWDISQTDPDEVAERVEGDDCPSCDATPEQECADGCGCLACATRTGHTDAEPADVAFNRLQEQIVAAGYRFGWPATTTDLNGARVRVDHHAATVHVHMFAAADPRAIADLAAALGAILTRQPASDPDSGAVELAATKTTKTT
ncbi:MAG: ArdC-like ssDNA-binding domain-containing protein [Natronosporangium sp.]